jgi:hypothetical protein
MNTAKYHLFYSGKPGAKAKKSINGLLLSAYEFLKETYINRSCNLYKLVIYTTDETFDIYGLCVDEDINAVPYTTVYPVFDVIAPFYLLMDKTSGDLLLIDHLCGKGSLESKEENVFCDIESFKDFVNTHYSEWFADKAKAMTHHKH